MTLKTDFSDGDIFYTGATSDTDKLNGITTQINKNSEIHIKHYTNDTEYTHTGDTSVTDTNSTFVLAAPINSYILSIHINCDLKYSDADKIFDARLKISGTNIGNYYLKDGSQEYSAPDHENGSFYLTTNSTAYTFTAGYTSYGTMCANTNNLLKVLDASTTFVLQVKNDYNSKTSYVDNVTIDVVYSTPVTED